MKRTLLPLNALRVFDAAARHLSFTRAADELAVTPAAVGQQIRALEDVLGVVLFRRTSKGLELTDEASAGLERLRSGFLDFEESVRAMQAGQSSHMLTIAAPRDLFSAWLAPRLAQYAAANPQTRFAIVDAEGADFAEANLDLSIRWTDGPGDLEGVQLGDAMRATVGEGARIAWPGDPLADGEELGCSVADAGQAVAAAAAGLGQARVPALLAEALRESGRGATPFETEPCRRAYWLAAPVPQWRQKKVQALVAALTA